MAARIAAARGASQPAPVITTRAPAAAAASPTAANFSGGHRRSGSLAPGLRATNGAAPSGTERRASARSAAVVAGWARYCEGVDEDGQPIEIADRRADILTANARRQREDPRAFIADRALFGDLADDERFTSPYLAALTSLHEHGAQATLEALVKDSPPGSSAALRTTRP